MAESKDQLVFGYWACRGLGEPSRLTLQYTKTAYTEKTYHFGDAPEYSHDEWLKEKFNLGLDFPNLPYLMDGDLNLTQSKAILYYLGRKFNLLGTNAKEEALIKMLCEQAYDLRVQYGVFCYDQNGDSESERKKFLETNVTEYIKQFDAFLSKNKSKFAVGDKPTVADFQLFDYIDASCSLEGGRALLDKYTNVKELLQRVRELSELKDYIPNAHAQLPISGKMSKFGGQVDTFSRAYLFDQAQKFIDEFEKSHRPSIPMNARNTSLSRKIFDRIQSKFSDVQSCLTSVTVLLADPYALSGNKLIASNIRTKLSQSSMKKAVGYSWTVINGKIFKFRAHDPSHPCSQEIYVELDRLRNELIEHGYKYDESWIIRPLENGETAQSILSGHSERLAIALNLIQRPTPTRIQIVNNLRICGDCR
ncbi:unnamed protein product [Rotaria sordida]|uniref:glutathione transferase n=2 Tax=Rotaria sordida TaxID=392033 RepID=A0A818U4T9_9BILA|nr:unnamed protein product [Rotaria sordida]